MNKMLDANQNGDITILKAELGLSDNCYSFDKVELETYNIFDLINQLKQCKEVIEETINTIGIIVRDFEEKDIPFLINDFDNLLKILQKYKGDNK